MTESRTEPLQGVLKLRSPSTHLHAPHTIASPHTCTHIHTYQQGLMCDLGSKDEWMYASHKHSEQSSVCDAPSTAC